MKRPSFQFYPGDWTSNGKLRRCSHSEKGIWIDVLCLLHDQEDYGTVRWPLRDIAQAVHCTLAALRMLADKRILKGGDVGEPVEPYVYVPRSGRREGTPVVLVCEQTGPVWYSSRMVRDEYVRTIRGNSSRFGAAEGDAPNPAPKPSLGDGSSSSSSTSSNAKTKTARGARFDAHARLVSLSVEPQIASDWLTLRSGKRLKPTETAIAGVLREAQSAALSLNDALRICCTRGWGGFQAEWLLPRSNGATGPPFARLSPRDVREARDREMIAALTGRDASRPPDVFDLAPEDVRDVPDRST
ncbi:hypothetical protein [Paraburkholderia sp. 31.1]|uniref:hypothetical protein n=1 Tax=Paraburkholderia sp. 31.1 TaxID=2615205 RepID=UPI001654FE20|nr:hypothetical protein [Paraburkholderia sp. 31.1]